MFSLCTNSDMMHVILVTFAASFGHANLQKEKIIRSRKRKKSFDLENPKPPKPMFWCKIHISIS